MQISQQHILINISSSQTRVAVLESAVLESAVPDNAVLQEIHIERQAARGCVSRIYKGKVLRVLPGMQAAFVDIGLARAAFIHAVDIQEMPVEAPPVKVPQDVQHADAQSQPTDTSKPDGIKDITQLVREGQTLIVQVIKEPLGSKGARLTTRLSLASRYLVLLPYATHLGISQKISDPMERERLQNTLLPLISRDQTAGVSCGVIVRTVAEGVDASLLTDDLLLLQQRWHSIQNTIAKAPVASCLYEDLPLHLRVLRDVYRPSVQKISIDDASAYAQACEFVAQLMPGKAVNLELYQHERPLFDAYAIEEEIDKALQRQVPLPSGGYLVFDQTEAMTTIDVNTGAFVGGRDLEDTFLKTNLEACDAIARQLRLRNLGGIIVIDFIDMQQPEHGQQLLQHFAEQLSRDPVKTYVSGLSALGLVEMTRKRTRESLQRSLCEPCAHCDGRGFVKSTQSIAEAIYRDIVTALPRYPTKRFQVLAAPDVVACLQNEAAAYLTDLTRRLQASVQLQVETLYHQEQFDVVPL